MKRWHLGMILILLGMIRGDVWIIGHPDGLGWLGMSQMAVAIVALLAGIVYLWHGDRELT